MNINFENFREILERTKLSENFEMFFCRKV